MKRLLVATAFVALFLTGAAWLVLQSSPTRPAPRLDRDLWRQYASRFVTAEGRVIDRDNGSATHTEGQGYGMLLAEAAGDRARFARLWMWTKNNLTRPDGLFSWHYGPCPTGEGECVTDKNDASDGDILIAWALLRAGRDWNDSGYTDAAREIAAAVAQRLVVRVGDRYLLLPGVQGFEDDKGVTLNPSYWIFPALEDFANTFGTPVWRPLADSGYTLLREARFGRWNLPADWVRLESGKVRLADKFPPQYGFNAVRVPLYADWGGTAPADVIAPFLAFWKSAPPGKVPAWIDLSTDKTAPYPWQTGMAAIAAWSSGIAAGHPPGIADLPKPRADEGYYSWSLALLTRVAAADKTR